MSSIEAVQTRLAEIEARRNQIFTENENRFREIYREKLGRELPEAEKTVSQENQLIEEEASVQSNASVNQPSQGSNAGLGLLGSSSLYGSGASGLNTLMMSALLAQMTGGQSNVCASCGASLVSAYQGSVQGTMENSSALATGQFAGAAPYMDIITACSQKYDVPVNIILGVMKIESGFKNNRTSSAGAQGLMQLMPRTAKSLGVRDPMDPAQNIEGGVKYIRKMLDMFDGDIKLALAAYNTGPGNVKKRGSVFQNIPSGVQGYVNKVLKYAGYASVS